MRAQIFPALAALSGLDAAAVRRSNRLVRASQPARTTVAALARWLSWLEVGLMVLLALGGRRGTAVRMLVAVAVVYVASEVLGAAWPRERPFSAMPGVDPLVQHAAGRSFPSRHIASGLAMAAIGGRAHPRLGRGMSAVAWLLGASRVAAGLHYPSDVLGGALLGRLISAGIAQSM